jgi:hypothetical protein
MAEVTDVGTTRRSVVVVALAVGGVEAAMLGVAAARPDRWGCAPRLRRPQSTSRCRYLC